MISVHCPAGDPLHALIIILFSLVVVAFIFASQPRMPKCGWCGRCDDCKGKRADIQRR